MTGDLSQPTDLERFNGGFVSFAGGETGQITQRGIVRNGALCFNNVNYVLELKHSMLSVSQICDNGFSTHFTKKGCFFLKPGVVIPDEWVLLKYERR